MNNTRAKVASNRPVWSPETERGRPATRHGSAERSGDLRLPQVAAGTVLQRHESRSNRWETDFYNTAILPIQFFTVAGRASEFATGAQRLMFAVLQDAVVCWFRWRDRGTARKRRLFQETYDWFWAQNSSGLYAFENICEVLKLDPGYIRRGLMRWHPGVQGQQSQPAVRRLSTWTRHTVIPHVSMLVAPRLARRRSGER